MPSSLAIARRQQIPPRAQVLVSGRLDSAVAAEVWPAADRGARDRLRIRRLFPSLQRALIYLTDMARWDKISRFALFRDKDCVPLCRAFRLKENCVSTLGDMLLNLVPR